ncbi:MAG: cellulase family glycosylhydrolase [Nocardioides sp.]|nr:cellulase family glycosylhydrolase [Nocardioides sp.]
MQYRGNWGYSQAERTELLAKLSTHGVEWLRIGVRWASIQPDEPTASDLGRDPSALSRVDRIIREAHARGFLVSVTFNSTPDWANGGRGPTALPSDPSDYARAVAWMAERYRGQVQSWEIYNEPNNERMLRATPATYVPVLCAAYRAIHRVVPDLEVVTGGTSGNDWEWVEGMYEAGAKGCFDVLATHPYQAKAKPPSHPAPNDRQWWFQNISLVREVMLDHHDAGTPVWFTEVGWSTHPGVVRKPGVTLEQQADYIEELFRFTAEHYPYVERINWYQARDEPFGDVHRQNFGLFFQDLEPKPSARRLRNLIVR